MMLESNFTPPWFLRSAHLQSIAQTMGRRLPLPPYQRETLELQDGDFLDLDWLMGGHGRLVILSHGLEGSSRSSYARGFATLLAETGWDVLVWNMRGCSGIPNRLLTWYHSGLTSDLASVIEHAASKTEGPISLIGVSIGGNITLKYLGEREGSINPRLTKAATLSVPVDITSASSVLADPRKRIYMEYLLKPLKRRIREKGERFPGAVNVHGLDKIKTFLEFDSRYTAPLHGFSSANEYWKKSSSLHYLPGIKLPTLLVNALDDPFLSKSCFPVDLARKHDYLRLEIPRHGGHVGFIPSQRDRFTWAERRIVNFLSE